MIIKIRYNTDKDKLNSSLSPWRVIIDGEEFLAEKVTINTASWTTYDEVEQGKWKWHITCDGILQWDSTSKNCEVI